MCRLWRDFIGAATVLVMFGAVAAQAQDGTVDASDYLVWRANFGVGATESAELILDNSGCQEPATVAVDTTDQQGLVTHEVLHVAQNGGTIYPLPLPTAAGDRSNFGIEVRVEPGPCVRVADAALAIISGNDATAAIRHTPEWSTFNDHDPGGTETAEAQNNFIHIPPTRIGPGQSAEFGFWNNCPAEVKAELRLQTIETGTEELLTATLAPSQFKQLILAVPGGGSSVHIVGFGTFEVTRQQPGTGPCPPGLGLFTGTLSLSDDQGNSTAVSGLPTGKRQHKPLN